MKTSLLSKQSVLTFLPEPVLQNFFYQIEVINQNMVEFFRYDLVVVLFGLIRLFLTSSDEVNYVKIHCSTNVYWGSFI